MRLAVIALLLAACSSSSALAPTAAASPAATASPTREARFDPRAFTVGVGAVPGPNQANADRVMGTLLTAWREATYGRSEITVQPIDRASDVYVVFSNRSDPTANAHNLTFGKTVRLAEIFALDGGAAPQATVIVLHELGHILGCCSGAGTRDGHWTDCDVRPAQLMCGSHSGATTFSERELAQMGLAAR